MWRHLILRVSTLQTHMSDLLVITWPTLVGWKCFLMASGAVYAMFGVLGVKRRLPLFAGSLDSKESLRPSAPHRIQHSLWWCLGYSALVTKRPCSNANMMTLSTSFLWTAAKKWDLFASLTIFTPMMVVSSFEHKPSLFRAPKMDPVWRAIWTIRHK